MSIEMIVYFLFTLLIECIILINFLDIEWNLPFSLSFLFLNTIPLYEYTTFCIFIYPLKEIWTLSSLGYYE